MHYKRLPLLVGAVLLCAASALSQTPPVPNMCPTPVSHRGWAQGRRIYYRTFGFTAQERNRIVEALRRWTDENANNNSRVQFGPEETGHPANLTIGDGVADRPDGTTYPAITRGTGVDSNGDWTDASITIDTENLGGQFFDRGASTYLESILKVALHEVGHTMGLGDQGVISGRSCGGENRGHSVMNQLCNINDTGGAIATRPTDCDRRGVNSNPSYATPDPCQRVEHVLLNTYDGPATYTCYGGTMFECRHRYEVWQEVCRPSGAVVRSYTVWVSTFCLPWGSCSDPPPGK